MPRAEARRERLLPFRRAQAELRPVSGRLAMEVISGDPSVVDLYNEWTDLLFRYARNLLRQKYRKHAVISNDKR
jgi:hypothetical protein